MNFIKSYLQKKRNNVLKKNREIWEKECGNTVKMSVPPQAITIGITNRCNNQCLFCAYHSQDAKTASNVYNLRFDLPYSDFKKMTKMAFKGYVPRVHVCGTGEPFMHKDILRMIDYVIKMYGFVSFQTNFYKPLFDKFHFLDEIIKRRDAILYIATDIMSGNPLQHDDIKKGSKFSDLLDSMGYIGRNSDIKLIPTVILTKQNYKDLIKLPQMLVEQGCKNVCFSLVNLMSYDFNDFSASTNVYVTPDSDITQALANFEKECRKWGLETDIPQPADTPGQICRVFWEKVQTWPVRGCHMERAGENLIPHACRAVVRGNLKTLGYMLDYKNIMDMWNNEYFQKIRRQLCEGKYPSEECRFCYMSNQGKEFYKSLV